MEWKLRGVKMLVEVLVMSNL